jgi:hypothetical protein
MQTRDQDVNPAAGRVGARESPVLRPEHAESSFTRLLEQQAAKIPSDLFLSAAIASMVISLGCELTDRRRASRFIGMWPGPLLVMGVYNKLVKLLGPR